MLVSPEQLEKKYNLSSFDFYSEQVDLFTNYLRQTEKVNVALESAESEIKARQGFESLPKELQAQKILNFSKYYNHCFKMISDGYSLRDRAKSLEAFAFMYGLSFPCEDEIFELMGPNVYAEIYDRHFLQIYRSPDWLETTSYGLKTLETSDWRNLFARSENVLKKQMEVVTGIYSGQVKLPVLKPVEQHTVKELYGDSPYCCEVESLLYSPVYNLKNEFVGGLHLMKLHDLRTLSFKIVPDYSL